MHNHSPEVAPAVDAAEPLGIVLLALRCNDGEGWSIATATGIRGQRGKEGEGRLCWPTEPSGAVRRRHEGRPIVARISMLPVDIQ